MKKNIIVIVLFFISACSLVAQERYFDERYTYTQAYLYPVVINPGATGFGESDLIFNYRNKWSTFPGTPKTLTLSYNGDLGNRLGFGGLLLSDTNGALETTKGQLSFSYTIDSEKNNIGFGISTEYIQHKIGNINGQTDPTDAIILDRLAGNNFFDVSFGIYGEYDNSVKYGLTLPALISSKLDDAISTGGESAGRDIGIILHLGYEYDLPDSDVKVEPSVIVKKLMFVPTHVDLNLKATFLDERLTGGLTYTVGAEKRLGFLIGTAIRNLNLYYSYNVSSQEFQQYNNGSHDLTLRINLAKEVDPQLNIPMGK